MVARLGPTIFCEGVARGADVRLLEAARAALVVTHPLADRVELRAANAWMSADFHADGPLWARVDGKKLLSSLRDRFDPTGKLGDRDAFRDRLVNHAVLHPPPALRADLAALLETMQRR